MFVRWKETIEIRGHRINLDKTLLMESGASGAEPVQLGRYPCGVCGRGVGVNSILCTQCDRWCHKRCSGLRSLSTSRICVS